MNLITLLSSLSLIFCLYLLWPLYKQRVKKKKFDLFEPVWFSSLYFILIFFIRSVSDSIFGSIFLGSPPFEYSIIKAWILAISYLLISFVFFIYGYTSKAYSIIVKYLPSLPTHWNIKKTKIALFTIIFTTIGMTFYYLRSVGGLKLYLLNKTLFLSSLGSFIVFFLNQFLTFSLLISFVLSKNKKLNILVPIILLVLTLSSGLITGSKFLFVLPIVSLITLHNYAVKKIHIKTVVVVFLILFLLIPSFYAYRFSGNFHEFLSSLKTTYLHLEVLIQTMLSRFHGMDMLIYIIKYTPKVMNFQMGKTLLPALIGWIPRWIWPDKPIISLSTIFTQKYLYGFKKYYTAGSVASVTMIGESYINFHISGILLISLFVGILLRTIYEYLIKKVSNISAHVLYSFIFIYLITIWESSFAAFFSKFFFTTILGFLILTFFGERNEKKVS